MKAEDFRGLVEQLGDLTEVQQAALQAALAGKGSANEAVALIETRFAAAPACGHCGSESFGTWGRASSLRRYKCRDCHRTFNALTGTPLAQLHRRDAWLDYARALVDRISLRKAAERADVCLETSFRWRHRFRAAARDKRPSRRHRHRGSRRNADPEIGGQGLEAAGRPSAQKARRAPAPRAPAVSAKITASVSTNSNLG